MTQTLEFSSPLSTKCISLQEILGQQLQAIQLKVVKDIKGIIASGNEEQYTHRLIQEYTINIPHLNFEPEHIEKTDRYEDARGNLGRTVKQWVITFHIPYTGDISLLQYLPRSGADLWYPTISLQGQHACFEVRSIDKNPELIRQEKERILTFLQKRVDAAIPELETYNQAILTSIPQTIEREKQRYNNDKNLLQQL